MRRGPEPVAGAMSKPPSPSGTTSVSPASEFSSVPVTPSTVTSVPGVRSSKVRALESSFVVWWMFVAAPTLAYRMPLGVTISRVWSSARTDRILPVRPYLLTNPQLACSANCLFSYAISSWFIRWRPPTPSCRWRLVRTRPKRVIRPCYVLSALAATRK